MIYFSVLMEDRKNLKSVFWPKATNYTWGSKDVCFCVTLSLLRKYFSTSNVLFFHAESVNLGIFR